MNEYDKQAKDFLEKTESEMSIEYIKYDYYFDGDKEKRDIYQIELKRGDKEYAFTFGQSIPSSGPIMRNKPTEYDILSCLQGLFLNKPLGFYDVGSFDEFCADYGYSNDSISARNTYKSVMNEYKNLCMLYSDSELELLAEIQ